MLTMEFPGCRTLIDRIDAAVNAREDSGVANALREAMCCLIRDPDVRLPACVLNPAEGHYARREIYHSEAYGYSVIAMTWGPGQRSEEHTSELQSLMRISYAVFCLKTKITSPQLPTLFPHHKQT